MEPVSPNKLSSVNTDTKRRNSSARRLVIYAMAILLFALILTGLWPKATAVEVGTVTRGSLQTSVTEEGRTRIKERFTISAPVAGQLRRIEFDPGAEVKEGETVLAIIDPLSPALLDVRSRTAAEARRDAASATLEKARSAHRLAKSELERMTNLHSKGAISNQEFEIAQTREESAARDLAAAEGTLREAEAQLAGFSRNVADSQASAIEVKSPVSGRILRVFDESSRAVTPGTPLLEVGNPEEMEVVIEVLSRDGASISPGAKVIMTQWGGEPLIGKVRLVEPAAFTKISALGVEEQRVNVIADIITPIAQRLTLGDHFRVESKIITWETDNALKVPSAALFRDGANWATFIVNRSGRTERRLVKTGKSGESETQVVDGLAEGEKVIIYPGDNVRENQRVREMKI